MVVAVRIVIYLEYSVGGFYYSLFGGYFGGGGFEFYFFLL